jgi:prepilin-type N-terminal cleavage/methylation domain-containing protein
MKINITKGFTLIELLVVISIIGLLSSVVLASLSTARGRAIDSKLIQLAGQLQNVFALELLQSNSYANFNRPSWRATPYPCTDTPSGPNFTGIYAADFIRICSEIVTTSQSFNPQPQGYNFWTGQNVIPFNANTYSFMIYLPHATRVAGSEQYYCVGSNGKKTIGTSAAVSPSTNFWSRGGCVNDPTL